MPDCLDCGADTQNQHHNRKYCDECRAKRQRERNVVWRHENPEKHRESVRNWQQTHPDEERSRHDQWREDNPEQHREISRQVYWRNPEKYRDYSRQYREDHPEQISEYHKQRHREKVPASRCRRCDVELPRVRGARKYCDTCKKGMHA